MRTRTTILCILLAALCVATGCKMGQAIQMSPESHFNYPNSNVTPLGPVEAKMSGSVAFYAMPDIQTGDLDAKLYQKALMKVPEANLIIDYVKITNMYYAYVLPIYWTEIKIEGTAAKMEVGKQALQ